MIDYKNLKTADLKELIDEAYALDGMINDVECYSTKDMLALDAVLDELDRRGYTPKEQRKFEIVKMSDYS